LTVFTVIYISFNHFLKNNYDVIIGKKENIYTRPIYENIRQ
jgi:hypothetical protein